MWTDNRYDIKFTLRQSDVDSIPSVKVKDVETILLFRDSTSSLKELHALRLVLITLPGETLRSLDLDSFVVT